MNNFNTLNNCLKIISILIFVFIILKYVVVMSFAESIILATIMTVTVILIENLLLKNNNKNKNINFEIPKSCDSCKINIPKKSNIINDNILVLSDSENKSLLINENFTSVDSIDNDYEYKCYKTKKENFDNLSDNSDISSSLRNNKFITPIPIQSLPQQTDMIYGPQQTDMIYGPQQTDMIYGPQQTDMIYEPQQIDVISEPPMMSTVQPPMMPTVPPPMMPTAQPPMMPTAQPPMMPTAQPPMMPTMQPPMMPTTQPPMMPTTQPPMMSTAQPPITDKPVYMQARSELDTNIIMEDVQNRGGNTYDVDSVQYQQDGIQNEEDDKVLDNNIFRMSVGNRSVVNKFIESGGKYYGDILTRSTNAPSKFQAATNELKYGDFNYIAPLNKGMINPAYTFVSPTNWYPIPPHPPVCVTNKRCTTSPIIMGDGKDYMNFASLEDFDASRRFTGDMGINIDYIKNVLNNTDGN